MTIPVKGILIIDEEGFSRVCSAILEREGYRTEMMTDARMPFDRLNDTDYGLVITSYPFGSLFFEEIRKKSIPAIILSDHINRDLIKALEDFDTSYSCCMIKPLDYEKFRTVVKQVICGEANIRGEYSIV